MNWIMFILISFFILTYAGALEIKFNESFPPYLKNMIGHEEYLAKEATAMNSLVATEDVIDYWNNSDTKSGFGESWIILPDGNGTANVALMHEEPVQQNTTKFFFGFPFDGIALEEALKNVIFHLFTAENPSGVSFKLKDLHTLNFPKKDGVKIICHGWRSSGESDIIQDIKNAYIAEQNVTVIGVDWSYGANNIIYTSCAKQTSGVGKTIGELIDGLVKKFNLRYEDFHIIGHSLGAHIAGFAGRMTESKVGRITGLDPALPGFQYLEIAGGRLDKADANFVDVIHSCASSLGMSLPVGHVDFYPNGGSPKQPGCALTNDVSSALSTLACSHARSYEFFEQSIRNGSDFLAVQCDDWTKFKAHDCYQNFTQMGDRVNKNSVGTYYLKTDNQSPFYLGVKGITF